MASQGTILKLVTWRVKDWAACFLPCKIPLDKDGVNNNNVNTNNNNNLTLKRIKRKMKSTKKKKSERKVSQSPTGTRHHLHLTSSCVSPTSASQPPVADEAGFIDFCFDGEDGGCDVVREEKQDKKKMELSYEKSLRTANRKLIYGDQGVGGTENNNSLGFKVAEQDHNDKTTCQEAEDVSCDVHENYEGEEQEGEIDAASDKSSEASHSDERRGSFAFPTLGVEWIGSPVRMPKLDDLSLTKQKPVALGFQFCRF